MHWCSCRVRNALAADDCDHVTVYHGSAGLGIQLIFIPQKSVLCGLTFYRYPHPTALHCPSFHIELLLMETFNTLPGGEII